MHVSTGIKVGQTQAHDTSTGLTITRPIVIYCKYDVFILLPMIKISCIF